MQQCPLRLLRKSFGKRGQDSWPGLDKDNTRCSRIDMAEIRGYSFVRQFIVSEVVIIGTGSHDQVVISYRAIAHDYSLFLQVYAGYLGQQHSCVLLFSE